MRRMTKMLGLFAGLCLGLSGCGAIEELFTGNPGKKAEERVEYILHTVSATGAQETVEFQTSVCRWARDKIVIHDSAAFEYAYDGFREWVRRGGLTQGFEYEIEGNEQVEGSLSKWLVYGSIRGQAFEIVVPEGAPLEWKVAPQSDY